MNTLYYCSCDYYNNSNKNGDDENNNQSINIYFKLYNNTIVSFMG